MNLLCRIKRLSYALLLVSGFPAATMAGDITVFAAASLKEALEDVATDFEAATGHNLRLSFAGSSALARQIERGAPAEIFISANSAWMDRLETAGLLHPGTRTDLLGNRLVLIGPASSERSIDLSTGVDLSANLGDGPLAMALTDAVPAGVYGKTALVALGLWDSVAARVAETDNVRAALALVSLGAAPLGVVYATDAQADPRVRVVAAFPEQSYPPIVYPIAALGPSARAETLTFLDFLRRDTARSIFAQYGFRSGTGS